MGENLRVHITWKNPILLYVCFSCRLALKFLHHIFPPISRIPLHPILHEYWMLTHETTTKKNSQIMSHKVFCDVKRICLWCTNWNQSQIFPSPYGKFTWDTVITFSSYIKIHLALSSLKYARYLFVLSHLILHR